MGTRSGTRWERLTATRGRAATFFGTLGLFVVIAVLLPQPFLLGVPSGTYAVIGLLIVWLTALGLIEASWKRQDGSRGDGVTASSGPPGPRGEEPRMRDRRGAAEEAFSHLDAGCLAAPR